MKSFKPGIAIVGFGLLLFCVSNASQARVSIGLSIGTSFGHRYPGSCYGYHSYDPWYGGYYSWWDTNWHSHFPRRHYWPRRSRSSVGIWIGHCTPAVVGVPVIVGRSSVGTARRNTSDPAQTSASNVRLSEAMRKKNSEQLKILKSGDKEERIQAIRELAPFSFDNGIRQALENVLLSDPDPEIRQEVAVSFGKTENQLVLAALKEAKEKDPVRDVRQAAYKAIILIKGY